MALGMVKGLGLKKVVTGVSVNGKAYASFLYNVPDDVCLRLGALTKYEMCLMP